jgi:hypothetical protein
MTVLVVVPTEEPAAVSVRVPELLVEEHLERFGVTGRLGRDGPGPNIADPASPRVNADQGTAG